jgi:hypothetical protein
VGRGLVSVGAFVFSVAMTLRTPAPNDGIGQLVSQATPSPSRSSPERYPGCPRRRGALPAARTAAQSA